MLMLLFHVGNERYALESEWVVEVLPVMKLEKRQQQPAYVSGLFNYRGSIVPVIDLCYLIAHNTCRFQLSSRIIVVNAAAPGEPPLWVGLLAERVLETMQRSAAKISQRDTSVSGLPYLGTILLDEQGMIQCIQIDRLLQTLEPIQMLAEQKRTLTRV